MTVYIVIEDDYPYGDRILGVFDSLDKAEGFMAGIPEQYQDSVTIHVWDVK